MDINFDILEQLRQYREGELSASAERELEHKIATDEVYAFHYRTFKTLSKGVHQATVMPEKEWMRDLKEKPLTESEAHNLEKIIANDRAALLRRIFLFIVIGLSVLLIVTAVVLWKPWQPADIIIEQNTPARLQAEEIEQQQEEEQALGSTGMSTMLNVIQRVYTAAPKPVFSTQKNRVVELQAHSETTLAYLFHTDTLVVYSDKPDQLDQKTILWITVRKKDTIADFLKVEDAFYAIPYSAQKEPLKRALKEQLTILKMIPN